MELHEALRQIGDIRAHVARTEVFRGYKAATVGATGLLALIVAGLQPWLVPDPNSGIGAYLALWIGVAALSVAMVGTELTRRWLRADSPLARSQTLRAVEQFAPCVVAGAVVTWSVAWHAPEAATTLPGLWSVIFSLGVFASWRQLTPLALCVAFYYLAAGAVCLALASEVHAFSPWAMAGTFGVGQLLTAAILYKELEERHGQA